MHIEWRMRELTLKAPSTQYMSNTLLGSMKKLGTKKIFSVG